MNHSELRTAILARCREKLGTRYANKICSVSWFPDAWPPEDVMAVLEAMRRNGIISCTRESSQVVDGFLINLQWARSPAIRIPRGGTQ